MEFLPYLSPMVFVIIMVWAALDPENRRDANPDNEPDDIGDWSL